MSEKRLWEELRKLKLHIRRQAPIGRYFADFANHRARLVIEVDGPWHDGDDAQQRDAERDGWLMSQGYEVMRIRDGEALSEAPAVAARVAEALSRRMRRPPISAPFPSTGKSSDRGGQ